MRVIRNVGQIRRRRRRTRLLILVGVILLGFAVAAPLIYGTPTTILLSYGALIIGFISFIVGTQQHAKWSRKVPIDQAIDQALSRMSDRYAVIHYPELGGRTPEHIVVTPGGVLVLTTRDVPGQIVVRGRRWSQQKLFLLRFFNLGAPALGNPTLENELQLDRLEQFFDEHALPGELEGAIVFLSDDVEIEMHDPEVTVIHISELADLVREIGNDVQLSNEDRQEIIDALSIGEDLEMTGARPSRPKKRIKVAP